MPSVATVTRPRRTVVPGALALTLAAALTAGCQSAVKQAEQQASGSASAAACQPGGTLVAVSAQPPIPGRVLAQGAANFFWVRGVFEPLMTVNTSALSEKPQPLLASDWKFADDDLSVTLNLRQGVTFHSGRAFTSADVIFTIQQAISAASPSDVKAILSQWKVSAPSPTQVTITSPTPLSPVLGSTLDLTPIVDSETYAGVQDGSKLIGTGPFKVESYQPGAQMVLVKNDKYWQSGQPTLDRIENVAISDSTAQLSALRSGRAQLAFGMTTQDAQTITKGSNQFKILATGGTVYPLVLDTTQGVFQHQAARQAVGYAIERARINEQVLGNLGTTTGLYWNKGDAGYPKELENPYPYDPEKAKKMVADSGATGASVPITIINNPVLQAEYEIIAKNLTDVGLKPSLVALAAPDYQAKLASGKGGNYLAFRGQNGSPAFMVQTNADLRLQGAHRQFTSPEYTKDVQALVTAKPGDETTAALKTLTSYMNDQSFLQVLATAPGVAVQDTSVQNVSFGLGGAGFGTACVVKK